MPSLPATHRHALRVLIIYMSTVLQQMRDPPPAPGQTGPTTTTCPGSHQPRTFANAALPSDGLAADGTGLHLLEGLHLEVVGLGGLQVFWL